jgi:DNA modification methylase
MDIVKVEINKLNPAKYNPRKILKAGDIEYEKIKESILKYGCIQPIIVNNDSTIISGHQRLTVLKDLGHDTVDCVIMELSKKEEKKLNIAMNKISGSWDNNKLTELLKEFEKDDYKLTGFDMNEINDLFAEAEKELKKEKKEESFNLEKELEKIETPKSQKGDIYQLGSHVLMCGDSYNLDDINKLIGENKIDMMFTDPPYKMRESGAGCFKETTENLKKRIEKLIDFKVSDISHFINLNINTFYIFTSKESIRDYLNLFDGYIFNMLVWCKTNPAPRTNNTFIPDTEYILYFAKKNRIWNNQLKPFDIYKKYYVSSIAEGRKDAGDLHPTMKPLDLIENRIRISSKENGIVLDLFGGSGSTLIAAEKTKRKCFMMEIEPMYCDVIIKRYELFTGNKVLKMG